MNMQKVKRLFFSITAGLSGSALFASALFAQTSDLVSQNAFRVCADPANSPQSNEDGSGYENTIAEFMAGLFELPLEYEWFPMSTGFIRNTLVANKCDVVIGYSAGHELVLNTNPYYTSSYVLVTKPDGPYADVDFLGDERMKEAKVGLIAGTQPASHIVRYGYIDHIVPYQLFADRRYMNPNQDMIDAVDAGELDVAIMWGPIAGPMMKEQHPDYVVTPLINEVGPPNMFARITMGVRQGETEWKRDLNSQIRRHQGELDAILSQAGVPLLTEDGKSLKILE